MNPVFLSIIIILFGTGLVGNVSMGLAQGNPWTSKKDMPTARVSLSSSAVDGKIYVMGGESNGTYWGGPSSPIVEVYDPATDTWDTTKTDMPIGRNSFSSSVVNDTIYVFGGNLMQVQQTYHPFWLTIR